MLDGIRRNRIIAGGYRDRDSGGVCPMLAAHRNGGRTSAANFARSWDRYTGARRPRLATKREVFALKSYIELSLLHDEIGGESLATAAERIRAERRLARAAGLPVDSATPQSDTGDRHRASELKRRSRWGWLLPTRRYDVFRRRIAAAEEQLAEQRADEVLGTPERTSNPA